ncbi:hypothetical protein BpHYR1_025863 [Brachionus plicatilis]|uniref:Uncharacterized protein n=1 Tax=Brachionus plicatilis TaxID=10195 RepID=A0A3M7RDJ3_BRAPC|nr:hypothetical protein BpHYR1_025863 [Brachionus plicatilis]
MNLEQPKVLKARISIKSSSLDPSHYRTILVVVSSNIINFKLIFLKFFITNKAFKCIKGLLKDNK